ncbi:phage tail length tape measure family protein [Sagittula salina]|uniref:Phage tail length tape measure family protein n=1 Tax=Sagittula salina TaxID=2820268 RepID=A0A940MSN3_9RHOB|nr:phage tail length tape measure family protein [Sagittula salina]MBP0483938.1 phage tail length tape measure family protein [Sagittula salina]
MALKLHGRITADGTQAQAELRKTASETDRLSAATKGLTQRGQDAGRAIGGAATQSTQLARTGEMAAGSVANLTSQFNDIGVMLMAGQNPLQLAIQQGTQIGQVFQQTGVKGAAAWKMITTSVAAMLSPINLITIGSIAAMGVVAKLFSSSEEKAETYEDRVSSLSDRIKEYKEGSELASATTKELEERFGSAAIAAQGYLKSFSATSLRGLQEAQRAAIRTLLDETQLDVPKWDIGDQAAIGEFFDLSLLGRGRKERRAAINEVLASYTQLHDAASQSTDEQLAAAQRLREALIAGAELQDGISAAENERIAGVEELIQRLLEIKGLEPAPARDAAKAGQAWAEYQRSRILGERQYQETLRQTQAARAYGPYQSSRTASDAALASAREMLDTMREENALRSLAATYGEDSLQVLRAQQDAQRAVFDETLGTLDVAESMKEELRAAFLEGQSLAALDIAGGIWGAAEAASQLASNLSRAAAQKAAMAAISGSQQTAARSQIMLDTVGKPVERAGRLAADDFQRSLPDGGYGMIASGRIGQLKEMESTVKAEAENAARLAQEAQAADTAYAKLQHSLTKGAGGKGKSPTKKERDEVQDLLKDYDRRLAILRETDPVEQELLRHAEALTKAAQSQVDAVRQKIEALQNETTLQERIKGLQDFSGSLMRDGLDLMRAKGDAAYQIWDRIGTKILDVMADALIMGEGPLGGLFGGGIVPSIFKLFGFADGGMTYGPGGSRDDRILGWSATGPYRKSPGEFVVNSDATARHRSLLEAINAGAPLPLPRYADGGSLSGAAPRPWADMPIIIENHTGVEFKAREGGRDASGRRRIRFELAEAVGQGMSVRGGGADRRMKQLGLRQTGPRR